MGYEVSLLAVVVGLGVRLMFFMARNRERELRDFEEEQRRRAPSGDDADLLALIREQEAAERGGAPVKDAGSPFRTPGKVAPKRRRSGPVVDEVKRRCERCDMRVSPDRRHCSVCERALSARG